MEGLVHKAILELWRPDPSELTLLLTKGVDSTLLKVPPNAITLTGSSDPCYVEGYHLADSSDGRITLHLKVNASMTYFFFFILGHLDFACNIFMYYRFYNYNYVILQKLMFQCVREMPFLFNTCVL